MTGARLADGSEVEVDLVVVGIDIRPNQSLVVDAELIIKNGVAINAFCETPDPNILAAGDCASFPHNDQWLRLESVGNAIDMAETAAYGIMGDRRSYTVKPWFWSDQYEPKL